MVFLKRILSYNNILSRIYSLKVKGGKENGKNVLGTNLGFQTKNEDLRLYSRMVLEIRQSLRKEALEKDRAISATASIFDN